MRKDQAKKIFKVLKEKPKQYEVGFGKPPKERQFRRGVSGNPGGRPRGSKNKKDGEGSLYRMRNMILEESNRTVNVTERGEQISMPISRAVMRSLAVNAAKGDASAQKIFLNIIGAAESQRADETLSLYETVLKYKKEWYEEADRRATKGIKALMYRPYPKHLEVDLFGNVTFRGPLLPEELHEVYRLEYRRSTWEIELKDAQKHYDDAQGAKAKREAREFVSHAENMIEKISGRLEAWDNRVIQLR